MKDKIRKFLFRYIYPIFFYFVPISNNRMVFSSYVGTQYSGNPKEIALKMKELFPDSQIIWLVEAEKLNSLRNLIPQDFIIVVDNSLMAAFSLYTSKIWIDNSRKKLFYPKKNKQIYIQTWHGTPIKLIEADAGDKLSARYHRYAKRDNANINLLLSGNGHTTKIYKTAFRYYGEILNCGTPRNDIFFNESLHKKIVEKVKLTYNVNGKKIILFAPTFRNKKNNNGLPQIDSLEPLRFIETIENLTNEKYVFLYRFHSNVKEDINIDQIKDKYGDKMIDASNYEDMQELLIASDILLTDFSSSFIDYSLLRRPIFLHIPDYEEYFQERGYYFDLKELPFYLSTTTEQLLKNINVMSYGDAKMRCDIFNNQIENYEKGYATDALLNYVKQKLNEEEVNA